MVKRAGHWAFDRRIPIVSVVVVFIGLAGQLVATSFMISNFQVRTEMGLSESNRRIVDLEKNQDKIIEQIAAGNTNYVQLNAQFVAMQNTLNRQVTVTEQVRDELIAIKRGK